MAQQGSAASITQVNVALRLPGAGPATRAGRKRRHADADGPGGGELDGGRPACRRRTDQVGLRDQAARALDAGWHLERHSHMGGVEAMLVGAGAGGVLDVFLSARRGEAALRLHYRLESKAGLGLFEVRLRRSVGSDAAAAVCTTRLPDGSGRLTRRLARDLVAVGSGEGASAALEQSTQARARDSLAALSWALQARFGGPLLWMPHNGIACLHPELELSVTCGGQPTAETVAVAQLLHGLPLRFGWARFRLALGWSLDALPPRGAPHPDETARLWAAILAESGASGDARRRLALRPNASTPTAGMAALCRAIVAATPAQAPRGWALVLNARGPWSRPDADDPLARWVRSPACQQALRAVHVELGAHGFEALGALPGDQQLAAALLDHTLDPRLEVRLCIVHCGSPRLDACEAPLAAALRRRPHRVCLRRREAPGPPCSARAPGPSVSACAAQANARDDSLLHQLRHGWVGEATARWAVCSLWPARPITLPSARPGAPGVLMLGSEFVVWTTGREPRRRFSAARAGHARFDTHLSLCCWEDAPHPTLAHAVAGLWQSALCNKTAQGATPAPQALGPCVLDAHDADKARRA